MKKQQTRNLLDANKDEAKEMGPIEITAIIELLQQVSGSGEGDSGSQPKVKDGN